jgi:cytochrome c
MRSASLLPGCEWLKCFMLWPPWSLACTKMLPPQNAMFVEWARGLLNLGILDEKGDVMKLVPLWTQYDEYKGPLSFTIDNEGVLYILEWGKWDTTYAGALSGTGATISKMCYTGATEFVTAVCSVNIAAGPAPLSVKFDGSKSLSPAQASLAYSWDVDGDGLQDFADSVGSYVFTEQGLYSASLTVTSATGLTDTCVVDISVGNEPPVVTYRSPAVDRGFFCFNELFVSAEVSDVEDGSTRDGSISCDLVQADHILGHAEHGHNGGNIRLDNFTTPSEHAVCASTTPTSIGAHNLRTEDIFW